MITNRSLKDLVNRLIEVQVSLRNLAKLRIL